MESWMLSIDEFKKRTGLEDIVKNIDSRIDSIIPLKSIEEKKITTIEIMPQYFLENLLKSVPLLKDKKIKPYENSEIKISEISPKIVYIGQTFVQKEKIIGILNLEDIFERYHFLNINSLPPLLIYSKKNNKNVVSFYIPPIAEIHNNKIILIDDIHRSYISKGIGSTFTYITINNKTSPLPFDPHYWNEIKVVDKKPPLEERYFELKKDYFRNLKYVGIDG